MALKRTSIVAPTTAATSTKGAAPIVIEGRIAYDYATAAAAEKAAKLEKELTGKELKAKAMPLFYRVASASGAIGAEVPSSIKIQDDTGTTINVACKDSYSKVTPEVAEALFSTLGADVNEYVHEVPVAAFDNSVFTKDGEFNEPLFVEFQTAIARITTRLGIPNPLTVTNMVVPKDTFHARRFRDFPADKQAAISEAMPNTVALTVSVLGAAPAPAPAPAPDTTPAQGRRRRN